MPLHPQLKVLADGMAAQGQKPMHELTPDEAREGYRALGTMMGAGEDVASVEDRRIPGPAGEIPLRIYRPEGSGPFGVLVFYHGGGWVIGGLDTHDRECRALCRGAGCLVVAVDYRLAPEHPFPAAVDDSFAALRWVGAHAADLGGDPARIAVGGDSAGGNLSAVMAQLARDAGGPSLRFQLLVYPAVDQRQPSLYPSMEENAAGPFLTRDSMEYFSGHYLCDGEWDHTDPRLSPLLADSLEGLPPALVVTAEFDPLRDEGEAYAAALKEAGVAVELHRYDGMAHLFFQLSALVDDAKALLSECSGALKRSIG